MKKYIKQIRSACDCGEPATVIVCNEHICLRCQGLVGASKWPATCGKKIAPMRTGVGWSIDWDNYWEDFHKVVGGSLSILENKLRQIH